MRVFSNDSGCSLNFNCASVKSVTPTNIFWPENLNKCCNDFDIDNKFLETSSSKSASGDSESPEISFKVFDEFLMSHQEVVLDPKTALVLENLDCCCDMDAFIYYGEKVCILAKFDMLKLNRNCGNSTKNLVKC